MRISTLFYNVIIALNGFGMLKYIHLGKKNMWISYLEAEILKKRISRFRGRFCIFRGTQDQNLPQDHIIKVTVSRCISKWWSECWSNFYCLKPLIGANANSSNRVLCKKVGCAESEICSLEHLFLSIFQKVCIIS